MDLGLVRGGAPAGAPELDRIVVGLDPATTSGAGSDECGILVVGAQTKGPPQDWRAVVLADCTVQGATPMGWAQAVIAAMTRYGADRLVAEVNQGGQLVAEVLRQVDPLVSLKTVHAARGKVARAEPVAALYEQGRVSHLPGLDALEDQMCLMTARGTRARAARTASMRWSGRCMS